MSICEDCGDSCRRRIRCFHCGLLVCSWCWHHVHRCEPNHTRDKCFSLQSYKRYGKEYLSRVRARVLTLKGVDIKPWHNMELLDDKEEG